MKQSEMLKDTRARAKRYRVKVSPRYAAEVYAPAVRAEFLRICPEADTLPAELVGRAAATLAAHEMGLKTGNSSRTWSMFRDGRSLTDVIERAIASKAGWNAPMDSANAWELIVLDYPEHFSSAAFCRAEAWHRSRSA